jgi:hypothetical protein
MPDKTLEQLKVEMEVAYDARVAAYGDDSFDVYNRAKRHHQVAEAAYCAALEAQEVEARNAARKAEMDALIQTKTVEEFKAALEVATATLAASVSDLGDWDCLHPHIRNALEVYEDAKTIYQVARDAQENSDD